MAVSKVTASMIFECVYVQEELRFRIDRRLAMPTRQALRYRIAVL